MVGRPRSAGKPLVPLAPNRNRPVLTSGKSTLPLFGEFEFRLAVLRALLKSYRAAKDPPAAGRSLLSVLASRAETVRLGEPDDGPAANVSGRRTGENE
jgi:hypothetical protein